METKLFGARLGFNLA